MNNQNLPMRLIFKRAELQRAQNNNRWLKNLELELDEIFIKHYYFHDGYDADKFSNLEY